LGSFYFKGYAWFTAYELKTTQRRFFLLGTGLGIYKSSRPGAIGGNLLPVEDEGRVESVVVCDENGEIYYMDKSSLRVIEIDDMNL
jgi:hypothetical protein